MTRNISEKGLSLITKFEGCKLKAYKVLGTERYYTIGYGHYGNDVKAGMTISKEQALTLLRNDIKRFEAHVNKYQLHYNFNQNQFDALCSFAYNVGNINGLTKNGTRNINEIENAFLLYTKSGGIMLDGLIKRRRKELELFKTPIYESENFTTDDTKYKYYNGTSKSIVDALKSVGEKDTSYQHRKKIAKVNGISNYIGSKSQNELLLSLLIAGELKKV